MKCYLGGMRMCSAWLVVLIVFVNCVRCKSVENDFRDPRRTLAEDPGDSCMRTRPLFESRNVTVESVEGGTPDRGPLCNGKCCTASMETRLLQAGKTDLEGLIRHHARSYNGLLSTAANSLRKHVIDLSDELEYNTLYLFSQVYRRMSVLSMDPIKKLFLDIRNYVRNVSDISNEPALNIESSVTNFFTNLFPLVYHHAVNLQQNDFREDYKKCLRQSINDIQPFGEIPRQVSRTIFKSLEATRVLLQALLLGSEVMNMTDSLLTEKSLTPSSLQTSCHQALLKMSYCPKCLGLDLKVKPCSGYCLNVMRGCLTQHVSELDLPWNGYVEAVERLVLALNNTDSNGPGLNLDSVIGDLDTKISGAIMYAMENGPSLEKKVKRACGHARLSEPFSSVGGASSNDTYAALQREPRPQRRNSGHAHTPRLALSISRSKGFFLNLADNLCNDDSFAEQLDGAECWNGQRIGEYTKTVIEARSSFEKYNPEVEVPSSRAAPDSRVTKLADKLGHMRQLVLSQIITGYPVSESFMQGDEAGRRGSGRGLAEMEGSGRYTDDDDMEDYPDLNEGSGSGNGGLSDSDITISKIANKDTPLGATPEETVTASANQHLATSLTSAILMLAAIFVTAVRL